MKNTKRSQLTEVKGGNQYPLCAKFNSDNVQHKIHNVTRLKKGFLSMLKRVLRTVPFGIKKTPHHVQTSTTDDDSNDGQNFISIINVEAGFEISCR